MSQSASTSARVNQKLAWACILLVLAIAVVVSMSVGAAWVSPSVWLGDPSMAKDLVWVWRAPRIAAAFFVGACLSVSGLLFQGVFRNPLAEPYLMGSAAGAAVGAAIALLLPQLLPPQLSLPVMAFVGAWAASWLVLLIGRIGGEWQSAGLLLAGVALAAILSALRSLLIMVFGDESTNLRTVISWQLGGIQTPTATEVLVFPVLLLVIGAAAWKMARGLDVLGLGEAVAHSVGIHVPRLLALCVLLAALTTALAVTWGGLVGFVGLIVPHVLRWWLGPMHARLIPTCMVVGGTLLIFADALARSAVAPSEIPIGVLTALVGGPFFIGLLLMKPR